MKQVWMAAVAAMLAGAVLSPASAFQGQPKGKGNAGGMKRMQAMMEGLNLTADQKKKIEGIVDEAKAEMKKIRDENKGDAKAARPKMRELNQGMMKKINAVLTPEQQAKLKEEMAKNRPAKKPAK